MTDMEFDIEKVESLDFEQIKNQLRCIFKTEQDIINFINFLKNIQKFVSLSNDKRHMTLIDLGYFKMQIQMYEKRIASLITKKKSEQVRNAIKKAKGIGEKITESTILYHQQEDLALEGLEELHTLVYGWSTYMQDLYFMCGQTNKNLGNTGPF